MNRLHIICMLSEQVENSAKMESKWLQVAKFGQ